MRDCSSGGRATSEGPGKKIKFSINEHFKCLSEKSAMLILSWLSFPGFQSFYCYSHGCWDEEAGRGEEEILLVTDVL